MAGINSLGVEINRSNATIAKEKGHNVLNCDLFEALNSDCIVDTIASSRSNVLIIFQNSLIYNKNILTLLRNTTAVLGKNDFIYICE